MGAPQQFINYIQNNQERWIKRLSDAVAIPLLRLIYGEIEVARRAPSGMNIPFSLAPGAREGVRVEEALVPELARLRYCKETVFSDLELLGLLDVTPAPASKSHPSRPRAPLRTASDDSVESVLECPPLFDTSYANSIQISFAPRPFARRDIPRLPPFF